MENINHTHFVSLAKGQISVRVPFCHMDNVRIVLDKEGKVKSSPFNHNSSSHKRAVKIAREVQSTRRNQGIVQC
jgi:hypothetical protein